MSVQMTNNACSTLVGALDDTTTTIIIGPEGAFFPVLQPGEWFYGTISDGAQLPEVVKVTAIALDGGGPNYTLTVERGAGIDGAAPKSWADTDPFQLLVTSELLYDLQLGGVIIAGSTSYILNSTSIVSLTTRDLLVSENGYLIGATANSTEDLLINLPAIPAVDAGDPNGYEDVRYLIVNRTANTSGTKVRIAAAAGETINSFNFIDLTQKNTAVVLHAKRGNIFWDAMTTYDFGPVPDDGNVYGVTHGPTWMQVVQNSPTDGRVYVRQGDSWVVGVEEAPIDGNEYVRIDGAWQLMPDIPLVPHIAAAVELSASQPIPAGTGKILFDLVVYDPDGLFDGTGTFTAPAKGVYNINVFINSGTFNQGSGVGLKWYIDGVGKRFFADTDSAKDNNDVATSGSFMIIMEIGEELDIYYLVEDNGISINANGYFEVALLHLIN